VKVTEPRSRKAGPCDDYPACRFGLVPGQRYRRLVYFPRDEGGAGVDHQVDPCRVVVAEAVEHG
jgi:hypothetical protein